MSPFRSVQKSRGKNVTTEEATTADKAEGTTEDSETTGETTADKAEGTTEDSETTETVEADAINTTEGRVDGITEGSETIEVDNGNSVAPSTTTIGRARSVTT